MFRLNENIRYCDLTANNLWAFTEEEYQEYQDLKKFKERLIKAPRCGEENEHCSCKHIGWLEWQKVAPEEADKDIEEWDKGIETIFSPCECLQECARQILDQETLDFHKCRECGEELAFQPICDGCQADGLKDIPCGELYDWAIEDAKDIELIQDRLDDLEGEIRTANKDLGDQKHTQKLINKIVQEQICEIVEDLKNVRQNTCTCGSTTKPRKGKEKSVKSVGK